MRFTCASDRAKWWAISAALLAMYVVAIMLPGERKR